MKRLFALGLTVLALVAAASCSPKVYWRSADEQVVLDIDSVVTAGFGQCYGVDDSTKDVVFLVSLPLDRDGDRQLGQDETALISAIMAAWNTDAKKKQFFTRIDGWQPWLGPDGVIIGIKFFHHVPQSGIQVTA